MKAKDNERLKEIRLSIYINHIDKAKDKIVYSRLLKVLSCVALSISGESNKRLAEIAQMSVCDGFMRASDKELYATLKTFFTPKEITEKLNISSPTYYRRYKDLMNRDYITDEYLESLKPMFTDSISLEMINILNEFISKFEMPSILKSNELESNNRTLELDFLMIYERLLEIFNNVGYVDKLIFNICNAFKIDYSTIAHLKNNIHIINRSYPNFRYNGRYLMQEYITLYIHRGYKKYSIATKVLNKRGSYLFDKNRKEVSNPIKEEDMSWQYAATIDWSNLNKQSVLSFINVFRFFGDYHV